MPLGTRLANGARGNPRLVRDDDAPEEIGGIGETPGPVPDDEPVRREHGDARAEPLPEPTDEREPADEGEPDPWAKFSTGRDPET